MAHSGNRRHKQRLNPDPGVVHFLLGKARVYDVHNAVNGQGSLCYVGRHDDFPAWQPSWLGSRRCCVENLLLLLGRQGGIQGDNLYWTNLQRNKCCPSGSMTEYDGSIFLENWDDFTSMILSQYP